MEWAQLFSEGKVVTFIFLYVRLASLFMMIPIFSHKNIPVRIKAALALFFSLVFYPMLPPVEIVSNIPTILIGILGEMIFGLVIGLVLQIAINIITFAGGQISFAMGFSMASAMDPQSGISQPIIGTFLSMLAMMVLLSLNMHHWILLFVERSLQSIPLGGFLLSKDILDYVIHASANMLLVGFMIAFPIYALTWLGDIVFGMLMKTMPQFNLLVIGMPVKITIALIVIMATLASTMLIMQREFLEAFNWLENIL